MATWRDSAAAAGVVADDDDDADADDDAAADAAAALPVAESQTDHPTPSRTTLPTIKRQLHFGNFCTACGD